MNWLRKLPKWAQWLVLSPIAIIVALLIGSQFGCATVDAPIEPLHEWHPVDYQHWSPTDVQPCVIAYDGVPWPMVDETWRCRGWMPI